MKVTVKVTGDKALLGSLSLMNVKGRVRLEKAVDHSSAAILADAQSRVPVGGPGDPHPGELKKSLRRKISASGMSASIMAGYGKLEKGAKGKGVYAPVPEFGSTIQPAQPYLFPSLEAEKPHFYAECEKAMDATCAEVKGV